MKKVIDWFDHLPETTRHNAIASTVSLDRLNSKQPTFWDALASAFTWSATPEGHEFWSKLAHRNNHLK